MASDPSHFENMLLYDATNSSKPCPLLPQKLKRILLINFIGGSFLAFLRKLHYNRG